MKKLKLIFVLFILTGIAVAQNNETLMIIGDKKITKDEFSYIYKKNNSDNINEQSLTEYLELFKNFKLKVVEAESLKMDTSLMFKQELNGYHEQLAKPYLTETKKIEDMIKEAFIRAQKEIKLDIIFIKVMKNASVQEKQAASEKAQKTHERLLNGEDFEKLALEISDDKSVTVNKGHLSFLQTLKIPYSIQNFVFNAKIGDYSSPVKTDYGYYLLKLVDTRPAQGYRRVAHIMINANDQIKEDEQKIKKEKIDSIYNRLLKGDKFEDLVKFSDDKGSAQNSGEIQKFTTGRMVPEFETAAFNLKKINEFSKPIKTTFGWHIIKLLEIIPPDPFDVQKDEISKVVEKDEERKEDVKNYTREKLKKELNYKHLNGLNNFTVLVDSSLIQSKWELKQEHDLKNVLFTIQEKAFTEYDFAQFIQEKQKKYPENDIQTKLNKMYDDFVLKCLTDIEKEGLAEQYSEYKYLMQEYHDGMLLFDLMKKEIWDKASEDSTGLKEFYNKNIEKYNNRTTVDISIFKYQNDKTFTAAEKLLKKSREKYTDEILTETINKKKNNKLTFEIRSEFSKGENGIADKVIELKDQNKNQKIINFPNEKTFVYINNTIKSKQKAYDEIKGLIISDYQKQLEDEWLYKLKNKYQITVNNDVFEQIKKNLNNNINQ